MSAETKLCIREILVATDFSTESNPAVEAAIALAGHFGARLHVLHVTPDPSRSEVAQSLIDVLTADVRNVETVRVVAVGSAAPEIVKYARREAIDLMVVGTHGRGGLSHVLMGSVAETIVRTAPCQVLTVGPKAHALVETPAPVQATTEATAHCLVCAQPSRQTICEACKARIRGEALERKRREEQPGHRGVAV